jgi:hypothetical protein
LDDKGQKGQKLSDVYPAITRYIALDMSGCTGEKYESLSTATGKEYIVELRLPSCIKEIGGKAFKTCTNLKRLYFTSAEPPKLFSNPFPTETKLEIWIPKESYENYKNAIEKKENGWASTIITLKQLKY